MRKAILIAVICCIMLKIQAQMIVEKTLDFKQKKLVVLDLQITDSINIQTWNKNEVYAYASIDINQNKDNEAYQTSFKELDDRIEIMAKFNSDYFKNRDCDSGSEIVWKIMIPENIELSVKTINGNITIKGKTTAVKAHTISGFVDLEIPTDKKADLNLKTISGNIYTDLDLSANVTKRIAELMISEKINGGGVLINLESISGDIFLRKN
jgi:hypothetical protein